MVRLRMVVLGGVLGVLAEAGLLLGMVLVNPNAVVVATRGLAEEAGWHIELDEAVLDLGSGWWAPTTWRWHVRGLAMISLEPQRPCILIEGIDAALPRPGLGVDGLVLWVPDAHVQSLLLHFDEVMPPPEVPPPQPDPVVLVVERLSVDFFGLTMRGRDNPEVIAEATEVRLEEPFSVHPRRHELHGALALSTAWVEVAGVRVDDIEPSRIAFTGPGMDIAATGHLGELSVVAQVGVDPLFGPPEVRMQASLAEGTLDGLADAIVGPGDLEVLGRVHAEVTLHAGGALPQGTLEGTAHADVTNAGFSQPVAHRAMIQLAVNLAPFLSFDEDGNVVVGDIHGGVTFTEQGVTFTTLTYEAPHSIGALRGYVSGRGVSAKLHFEPRPGEGAVEWGFILRGALRKPKVALAVPSVLRGWVPCDDPMDCPLIGGAP